MTLKYSPTPWISKPFDECQTIILPEVGGTLICIMSVGLNRPNGEDNTAIVTAAVNSYGKLGDRAIECAQQDLLGDALSALAQVVATLDHDPTNRARIAQVLNAARAVLSKAGI
jgi:hypothetical protein